MTLVVDVLGVSVSLEVPLELVSELDDTLRDLARTTGPVRHLALERSHDGSLVLLDDHDLVVHRVAASVGVATVVWRLNAIAASVESHVIVHAGCVRDEQGAIVLPGSSGAGKSWLTAAMVTAGYGYLSDEHAAIDMGTGLLATQPKPLDLGKRGLIPASDLRPGSPAAAGPPSCIVVPARRDGSAVQLTPLDPPASLVELCGHCPNLLALGAIGFSWLAGLATKVPTARVTYAEGSAAVTAIEDWRKTCPIESTRLRPATLTDPVTPTSATVTIGDEVVVLDLRSGAVHSLNRSAGLVWLCAPGIESVTQLVEVVEAEMPAGAIGRPELTATAERLCEVGLLELSGVGTAPFRP